MENMENLSLVQQEFVTETAQKKRGRPPNVLDPVKLRSLMASLTQDVGRGAGYLRQVTGFTQNELGAVLRALLKQEKIRRVGKKKGSTYVLV